jgi:hypothetical protein
MAAEFRITIKTTRDRLTKFGILSDGWIASPTTPPGEIEKKGIKGLFFFDPGTLGVSIDAAVAEELGLKPDGQHEVQTLSSTSKADTYTVKIVIAADHVPSGTKNAGMMRQFSGVTGIKDMHDRLVAIFRDEAPGRIIAIIGRSFLEYTSMVYDGLSGNVTIEIDASILRP